MADKAISELISATSVGGTDLFVIEQANSAKKLTGQTLENWLLDLADGHGGITSISKTGTVGLVDTYTILYADSTTGSFEVTNGERGATGQSTYVYIKYASREPLYDADMYDTPDDWMGIYTGISETAPTTHTSYKWYCIRGEQGAGGSPASIAVGTVTTLPAGSSATVVNSGTASAAVLDFGLPRGVDGTGAGTVTEVELLEGTNGGISLSGTTTITSSGSCTIGHSNVLSSAQTTQAVYPITIDKNGHISSYGNAVTVGGVEVFSTWVGGDQFIGNPRKATILLSNNFFTTGNFVYTISPAMDLSTQADQKDNLDLYERAKIFAYNITTNNTLTLGCNGTFGDDEQVKLFFTKQGVNA